MNLNNIKSNESNQSFQGILVACILILTIWTFSHYYPADDAYISFRYAKHLVEGKGLVWNLGEKVEGYSNFLWLLMVAAGMSLKIHPETTATLWNIPIYIILLILTYTLAKRILKDHWSALTAMCLTGLNHSIWGFARSGLETLFITTLFIVTCYLVDKIININSSSNYKKINLLHFLLGIILNLALLTRLDAGLIVLWTIWVLIQHQWRTISQFEKISYQHWILFIVPFIIIFLPYLIWKLSYFGSLIPNSARAKIRGLTGFQFGVYYIYMFALSTLLIPHLTLLIGCLKRLSKIPSASSIGLMTLIWFLYAAYVGGDFMEFRFLAPVLPLLTILLIWVSNTAASSLQIRRLLLIALALGIIHNWFSLNRFVFSYGMETTKELRNHLLHPAQNWIGVGKRLNQLFGGTTVKLSAGAAGAIPYYAELETVDFIGLTDPMIPKIGETFTKVPGHRVIAPVEYLYQRGVNLYIEPNNFIFDQVELNNWLRTANWSHMKRFYLNLDKPVNGKLIDQINLLIIPIDNQYVLAAWYMQPHPAIDKVARELGLRQVKISRW